METFIDGERNPYQVLQVKENATLPEIRAAHRKLVLKWHPDRVKDSTDTAEKEQAFEQFKQVQSAYEVLSDENSRKRWHEKVKLEELRASVKARREEWDLKPRTTTFRHQSAQNSEYRSPPSRYLYYDYVRYDDKSNPYSDSYSSYRPPNYEHYSPRDYKSNPDPNFYSSYKPPNYEYYSSPRDRNYEDIYEYTAPSPRSSSRSERRRETISPRESRRFYDSSEDESKLEKSKNRKTRSPRDYSSSSEEDDQEDIFGRRRERQIPSRIRRTLSPRDSYLSSEEDDNENIFSRKRDHLNSTGGASLRNSFQGLKGLVNGVSVDALADTGADRNFMNGSFAKKNGIRPRYFPPGQRPSFVMGHGRKTSAIGEVTTTWQFLGERGYFHKIKFYILADSIFDAIIGGPFLYETGTVDINRYRLSRTPKPRRVLHARVVNFCGSPSRRMNGRMRRTTNQYDYEACSALPDSGSEPNLLSYEFIKKKGWQAHMVPGRESDRLLMFADGSTERTEGQLTLQWSFDGGLGVATEGSEFSVTFDVLDGCPVDVILGQDFLDQTNAFTSYSDSFFEFDSAKLSGLNLVIRALNNISLATLKTKLGSRRPANDRQGNPNPNSVQQAADNRVADLVDQELQRRAEANHRTMKSRIRQQTEENLASRRHQPWDNDRINGSDESPTRHHGTDNTAPVAESDASSRGTGSGRDSGDQ